MFPKYSAILPKICIIILLKKRLIRCKPMQSLFFVQSMISFLVNTNSIGNTVKCCQLSFCENIRDDIKTSYGFKALLNSKIIQNILTIMRQFFTSDKITLSLATISHQVLVSVSNIFLQILMIFRH